MFRYNTVDLSSIKVGDKVLIRRGVVEEVQDASDGVRQIGNLVYRYDGSCYGVKDSDAVWILGTNKGPVNLNDYALQEGIYAIRADGEVLVQTALDTNDTAAPAKFAPLADLDCEEWYRSDGTAPIPSRDSTIVEVCAPKKVSNGIDLSDVKFGDRLLRRDGTIVRVDSLNPSLHRTAQLRIGGIYYSKLGLSIIDEVYGRNDLDIVGKVKTDREILTISPYFKDLALALLGEVSEDRLLTIPSALVLDIIKDAHNDVAANKVSTAFVSLLEGFSRSNENVKLPAKALRDLLSL